MAALGNIFGSVYVGPSLPYACGGDEKNIDPLLFHYTAFIPNNSHIKKSSKMSSQIAFAATVRAGTVSTLKIILYHQNVGV